MSAKTLLAVYQSQKRRRECEAKLLEHKRAHSALLNVFLGLDDTRDIDATNHVLELLANRIAALSTAHDARDYYAEALADIEHQYPNDFAAKSELTAA